MKEYLPKIKIYLKLAKKLDTELPITESTGNITVDENAAKLKKDFERMFGTQLNPNPNPVLKQQRKHTESRLEKILLSSGLSPFKDMKPQDISLYDHVRYIREKVIAIKDLTTNYERKRSEIITNCNKILNFLKNPKNTNTLFSWRTSSLKRILKNYKGSSSNFEFKITNTPPEIENILAAPKVAGGNVKYNKRDNKSTKKKGAKRKTRHKLNLSNRKTRHKLKRTKRRRRKH